MSRKDDRDALDGYWLRHEVHMDNSGTPRQAM